MNIFYTWFCSQCTRFQTVKNEQAREGYPLKYLFDPLCCNNDSHGNASVKNEVRRMVACSASSERPAHEKR